VVNLSESQLIFGRYFDREQGRLVCPKGSYWFKDYCISSQEVLPLLETQRHKTDELDIDFDLHFFEELPSYSSTVEKTLVGCLYGCLKEEVTEECDCLENLCALDLYSAESISCQSMSRRE